jgi:DNA-binding PadR family transcriptional regulator
MASKRKTRFAILGLLTWKPMSGYDIKKVVDVGLSHFWNENYGQIYPTLDQLVTDGLATKKAERKSGKRQRFVYTITRKGKQAFRDWISEPTDPPVVRNELQLKFFLSSSLPTDTSIRLIDKHRSQQQAVLDEYRHSEELLRTAIVEGSYADELNEILALSGSTSEQRKKQLNTFYLTLRHGIRVMEARLDWCEEVIANLRGTSATSDA